MDPVYSLTPLRTECEALCRGGWGVRALSSALVQLNGGS